MLRPRSQQGSALIGALFLIIVVAALGAFALNLQDNQRQEGLLQLTQHRVELAAQSGMEFWRFQLASGAACNEDEDPNLGSYPGLLEIQVETVECREFASIAGIMTVFEVEVTASHGNYGDPEFVRHTVRRTIRR